MGNRCFEYTIWILSRTGYVFTYMDIIALQHMKMMTISVLISDKWAWSKQFQQLSQAILRKKAILPSHLSEIQFILISSTLINTFSSVYFLYPISAFGIVETTAKYMHETRTFWFENRFKFYLNIPLMALNIA